MKKESKVNIMKKQQINFSNKGKVNRKATFDGTTFSTDRSALNRSSLATGAVQGRPESASNAGQNNRMASNSHPASELTSNLSRDRSASGAPIGGTVQGRPESAPNAGQNNRMASNSHPASGLTSNLSRDRSIPSMTMGTVQSRPDSAPNAGQNNRMMPNSHPASGLTSNLSRDRNIPSMTMGTVQSRPGSSPVTRRAPRATRLLVEPFNFLSFTQWECDLAFNQHGSLRISGLIAESDRLAYAEMGRSETWVHAKALDEDGSEIPLFVGSLVNLALDSQHQFHTMTIEIKTGSYLLDQTRHTRVFQPDETTFEKMIQTCLEPSGGEFIMRERNDAQAGQLTIQYQETNYDFIQRLSRRIGIVALPEYRTEGKRLLLGLNTNSHGIDLDVQNYRMVQGNQDAYSLIRHEWGVYSVETRDIYELGQAVNFQGRRLVINEINSRLEGSELIHRYSLCMLKPFYDAQLPFTAIKGVSLRGRVTSVERDRVEIVIHEDENNGNGGTRLFEYATVYSTPDGCGWFVQPDPGDEIRLQFPNADERGAYVVSSVHLAEAGGRDNPSKKSWKNKQNMEILFGEDEIIARDNNGSFIEVNRNKGIIVNSTSVISLQSDGKIVMNSQDGSVTAYGDRGLNLQQGSAHISVQDEVDISGGKINMN